MEAAIVARGKAAMGESSPGVSAGDGIIAMMGHLRLTAQEARPFLPKEDDDEFAS
jgi:hypothetical protein